MTSQISVFLQQTKRRVDGFIEEQRHPSASLKQEELNALVALEESLRYLKSLRTDAAKEITVEIKFSGIHDGPVRKFMGDWSRLCQTPGIGPVTSEQVGIHIEDKEGNG